MTHPSAIVILLPESKSPSRDDDHAAQRIRERLARVHDEHVTPPRTRPVLVDVEKCK